MDIARQIDNWILAVFVDTWLEYPQIRSFVGKFDNVVMLKPTMGLGHYQTIRLVLSRQGGSANHLVCEAGKGMGPQQVAWIESEWKKIRVSAGVYKMATTV